MQNEEREIERERDLLGSPLTHDDWSQLTVVTNQDHLLCSQHNRYHTLWLCGL